MNGQIVQVTYIFVVGGFTTRAILDLDDAYNRPGIANNNVGNDAGTVSEREAWFDKHAECRRQTDVYL